MRESVAVALTALLALGACEDFASPTGAPPGGPPLTGGATAKIRVISGDAQKGIARDTLLDPLVVEVSNRDGVALEGVRVRWKVLSGDTGGVVLSSSTLTDSAGLARNRWRVGNLPGATDSLIAFIGGPDVFPDTVFFRANITGVPDSIIVTQGAIELNNNVTREPEIIVGDTVFVQAGHWASKPFKATVIDSDGRTVRGAILMWTVTDDLTPAPGTVGAVPEGEGSDAVTVVTDDRGSITVWRKATPVGEETTTGQGPLCPIPLPIPAERWIGATLSLDDFPDVTPMTLDARWRKPGCE